MKKILFFSLLYFFINLTNYAVAQIVVEVPDQPIKVIHVGEEQDLSMITSEEFKNAKKDFKNGNYEAALANFKATLELPYYVEPHEKASIYFDIAKTLYNLGRKREALSNVKQSQLIYSENYSENGVLTGCKYETQIFHNYNYIAVISFELGRNSEALVYAQLALDIAKKNADDNLCNSYLHTVLNSTASILNSMGEKEKALKILKDAITKHETKHSKQKCDNLHELMRNAWSLAKDLHSHEDELIYITKIAESLNKQTTEYTNALMDKKNALIRLNKYDEALETAQESLKVAKEINEDVTKHFANLGTVLLDMGNYYLARSKLEEGLKEHKKRHGNVITDELLLLVTHLGYVYFYLFEYEKALDCFEKIVNYYEDNSLTNTNDLFEARHNYAKSLSYLEKHSMAYSYMQKTIEMHKETFNENDPLMVRFLNSAGVFLEKMNEHKKAKEKLEASIALHKKIHGTKTTYNLATLYQNLSTVHASLNLNEKALQYSEYSLKLFKIHANTSNVNLANAYNSVGLKLCNCEIKRNEDAIYYFEKALEIFREIYGENHNIIETIKNNINDVNNNKQPNAYANLLVI